MDQRLLNLIESARTDRQSGAARTLDALLAGTIGALEDGSLGLDGLRPFAQGLYEARGTMAPVFHLCDRLLLACERGEGFDPTVLASELRAWRSEERDAPQRIARLAKRTISGRRVLTLSRSSTVDLALDCMAEGAGMEVMVLESLPGGEGLGEAEALASRGIKSQAMPDSMAYVAASRCSAGISGADAVTSEIAVNKVGTACMAAACHFADRPVYLLCGTSKFTPQTRFDMMKGSSIRRGVHYVDQVFEEVPLRLFSLVITEKGVMDPSEVKDTISSAPPAVTWKEMGIRL